MSFIHENSEAGSYRVSEAGLGVHTSVHSLSKVLTYKGDKTLSENL